MGGGLRQRYEGPSNSVAMPALMSESSTTQPPIHRLWNSCDSSRNREGKTLAQAGSYSRASNLELRTKYAVSSWDKLTSELRLLSTKSSPGFIDT